MKKITHDYTPDIYTSDEFLKAANRNALLAARIKYNERVAPFVKNSSERLDFAKVAIENIIDESTANGADPSYVRHNLYDVIAADMKTAEESDDKRYREKGIGVDGEHVNEDLTNAGDSFNPFKEHSDGNEEKGVGVPGGNSDVSEEATTEPESQELSFDKADGEEAGDKGFGGGPENPPEETKDISEKPIDVEVTDVSYHHGPVLEDELREPDKEHDLKDNTFKWTKIQDHLILDKKKVV